MSVSDSFNGKRILITGAGRGIGRALTVRLYNYGAIVYALSKNPDNLSALKKECPNITTICTDVSDWDKTRAEVSKLEPLDGLINNAGVVRMESFMTIQPDTFDNIMNVNLKSVVNISQVVAEKMIANGKGGSIVNVSSVAARRATALVPTYSTSKAALDMLTKLMAIELGPNKIRVNSVNPGAVEGTDMTKGAAEHFKSLHLTPEILTEAIPMRQFYIGMDEVVNTILFVLSDMTTMITGESIAIDGGFLAT